MAVLFTIRNIIIRKSYFSMKQFFFQTSNIVFRQKKKNIFPV